MHFVVLGRYVAYPCDNDTLDWSENLLGNLILLELHIYANSVTPQDILIVP